ncbi:MAG: hypothetical protein ACT4OI_10970 [Methanobacteriota archaeon]
MDPEGRAEERSSPAWWPILKYLAHAYAFNLTFLVLLVPFAFVFVVLAVLGSWIGIFIGILLLFMLIGAVNSFFTRLLWFDVRGGWRVYLVHGLVLSLVLIPASLLVLAALDALFPALRGDSMEALPGFGVVLPSFLALLFVGLVTAPFFGFVMVRIARIWKTAEVPKEGPVMEVRVPAGFKPCFVCGAAVPDSKLYCSSCGTLVT